MNAVVKSEESEVDFENLDDLAAELLEMIAKDEEVKAAADEAAKSLDEKISSPDELTVEEPTVEAAVEAPVEPSKKPKAAKAKPAVVDNKAVTKPSEELSEATIKQLFTKDEWFEASVRINTSNKKTTERLGNTLKALDGRAVLSINTVNVIRAIASKPMKQTDLAIHFADGSVNGCGRDYTVKTAASQVHIALGVLKALMTITQESGVISFNDSKAANRVIDLAG